jgi:uncharacterized protein YdeI (YjbR/CyaY-like superfamily)
MPDPNPEKMMAFKTPQAVGKWLKANHASETELWVKIFKKGSGVPSISWEQLIIEMLCWGWIDGVKKSLDEHAYVQRITPRKARSNWS